MGIIIRRLPSIRVILCLRRIRLSGRTTRGGSFVVPPQDDTLLPTGTGSFGVRHLSPGLLVGARDGQPGLRRQADPRRRAESSSLPERAHWSPPAKLSLNESVV